MTDRPLKPTLDSLLKAAFSYEAPSDQTLLSKMQPPRGGGSEFAGLGVGLEGAGNAGMVLAAVGNLPRQMRNAMYARYAPRGVKCRCGAKCCKGIIPNEELRDAVGELVDVGVMPALSGLITVRTARKACVEKFFGRRVSLQDVANQVARDPHTIGNWNKRISAKLEELLAEGYSILGDTLAKSLPPRDGK